MRLRLAFAAVAMAGLVATAFVGAEEEEGKKKKDPFEGVVCPLSGKAVNPEQAVAYKEAKVYFCCPNCPKAFAKDPKKHAVKANHQLAMTKQVKQHQCPISGRELNEEAKTKVVGVTVQFCCENCQAKVANLKDDEKQQLTIVFADKVFDKAFKLVKKDEKEKEAKDQAKAEEKES